MKSNIIEFQNYQRKCPAGVKYTKREKRKDISRADKKKIEAAVRELLQEKGVEAAGGVDIVSIAKREGFLVQKVYLPPETVGFLAVNEEEFIEGTESHKWIVINRGFVNAENEAGLELKKSRFIAAHEYGHYMLHRGNLKKFAHKDTGESSSREDLEADYFARSMLMPLDIFQMACRMLAGRISRSEEEENYDRKVEYLSDIFKVTQECVRRRLEDLLELSN